MPDNTPAAEADNVSRGKENREATVRRLAESGVSPAKVQGDHTYGWTAQHGPAPAAPDAIPGQVFVPRQLPDPEVQRAWGVDPELHAAGLEVVSDEVALYHPGGPEADEAQRLGIVGTAYKDQTLDARSEEWVAGRDKDSQTDLDVAVAEYEEEHKDDEDDESDVDTDGLSSAQANAVRANVPAEDAGRTGVEDDKPAAKKSASDRNARRRGKTPAEAGSQTGDGGQGVK